MKIKNILLIVIYIACPMEYIFPVYRGGVVFRPQILNQQIDHRNENRDDYSVLRGRKLTIAVLLMFMLLGLMLNCSHPVALSPLCGLTKKEEIAYKKAKTVVLKERKVQKYCMILNQKIKRRNKRVY